MGLAIKPTKEGIKSGINLSVPFSSGWALQFEEKPGLFLNLFLFQFPFHRDGPCNFFDMFFYIF